MAMLLSLMDPLISNNNLPKKPPDCINFFICAVLNLISVAKLLLIAFLNLVFFF